MTTLAIIASARPELSALALKSLRRFCPDSLRYVVIATAGHEASEHARAIEFARKEMREADHRLPREIDHVILFDDDAVVLSDEWLPTLRGYHDKGYAVVGGLRHRGHVEQVMVDGVLVPHAHCLSFTRAAFDRVTTFHAQPEPDLPFLRYDTTVKAVLEIAASEPIKVLPFKMRTVWYEGRDIAVYYDLEAPQRPLWAHLGRGTSFAPRSPSREALRRVAARMGFKRAQKILRRQALREDFIRISEGLLT